MTLTENAQNYVNELTPLVKKYAEIYGYSPEVVPAIVAQSCYETGYGDMSNDIPRVAHNYFGIKHGGLNYYTGMTYDSFTDKLIPSENLIITPENRSHLWRAYDTMEDGVKGYFEFLNQIKKDIVNTRKKVILNTNNELILMYYRIGKGLLENNKYGSNFINNLEVVMPEVETIMAIPVSTS